MQAAEVAAPDDAAALAAPSPYTNQELTTLLTQAEDSLRAAPDPLGDLVSRIGSRNSQGPPGRGPSSSLSLASGANSTLVTA